MKEYRDEHRVCVGCHAPFVWSATEQHDDALRQWWPRSATRRPPLRCPVCRGIQKRIHPKPSDARCPGCGEEGDMVGFDRALGKFYCSVCGRAWRDEPPAVGKTS